MNGLILFLLKFMIMPTNQSFYDFQRGFMRMNVDIDMEQHGNHKSRVIVLMLMVHINKNATRCC